MRYGRYKDFIKILIYEFFMVLSGNSHHFLTWRNLVFLVKVKEQKQTGDG
jgi:hypothetical protein